MGRLKYAVNSVIEFFLNQQKENEEKTSERENDLLSNAEVIQEEKEFPRSLGTNLKPTIFFNDFCASL